LASTHLAAFWRSVRPVQSRQWIIRRYEIGLTQAVLRAGLRCAAVFPHDTVVAAFGAAQPAGTPPNIMHWFWDHLIVELRCPFIKRELLMYNPLRVPDVWRWQDVVRGASTYDTDLIVRHLRTQRRHDRSHMRHGCDPYPRGSGETASQDCQHAPGCHPAPGCHHE
jgi:lipopolysaccharide biosynthesis protein